MIANIDDNFSRVVNFPRESNLGKDSLLVFMTDNGTAPGAQVFNAGMRAAKGSAYEGDRRVSFFASSLFGVGMVLRIEQGISERAVFLFRFKRGSERIGDAAVGGE